MNRLTLAQEMRRLVGATIAVWFPESMSAGAIRAQIERTLDDSELFVAPQNTVLVVDGCPAAEGPTKEAAEAFRERCGEAPVVIVKATNEGQGGAVCCGIEALLAETGVAYIACRDGDGDHDIYDLPPMFRLLRSIEAYESTDNAYVIGARGSLHRPMGFARGEFEAILNRVKVAAVNAYLARVCHSEEAASAADEESRRTEATCEPEGNDGIPHPCGVRNDRPRCAAVDERYCSLQGEVPDFQSGYKLYTRRTAGVAAEALRQAADARPDLNVLRWGVQFVSTTELLLSGAITGAVHRLTYDEQPQSTFEGTHDYATAYGRQIAWLYRRLDTPPAAGVAWLDAAIAKTLYATVESGWEELLRMREYVIREAFGGGEFAGPAKRGEMM